MGQLSLHGTSFHLHEGSENITEEGVEECNGQRKGRYATKKDIFLDMTYLLHHDELTIAVSAYVAPVL